MNGLEKKQEIANRNEEALFLDGLDGDKDAFNDALIGWGERCGLETVAIYSIDKIYGILIEKFNMDIQEAIEWYDFNIAGAYMGENTPIYVYDLREI